MNPSGAPPTQRDQYDYGGPVNDLNNPPPSSSAGRMHQAVPMPPSYQSPGVGMGGRPYQVRA